MGLRFLITLIAILLIILILRYLLARRRTDTTAQNPTPITKMVRCAQCGIHVPEHEALRQNGHYYCSLNHSQMAKDRLEG